METWDRRAARILLQTRTRQHLYPKTQAASLLNYLRFMCLKEDVHATQRLTWSSPSWELLLPSNSKMCCYLRFRFPTFKQTQTEFIPIIEGRALPKHVPSLVFSAEYTNSLGGALGRVEATLKVSLFSLPLWLCSYLTFWPDQTLFALFIYHTLHQSHLFFTHWTIQWASHWNKTNI